MGNNPRHSETFSRFKGLGEMPTRQLGETVIKHATRNVFQVIIEDDAVVDRTISDLMGKDSGPKWEALQDIVLEATDV